MYQERISIKALCLSVHNSPLYNTSHIGFYLLMSLTSFHHRHRVLSSHLESYQGAISSYLGNSIEEIITFFMPSNFSDFLHTNQCRNAANWMVWENSFLIFEWNPVCVSSLNHKYAVKQIMLLKSLREEINPHSGFLRSAIY